MSNHGEIIHHDVRGIVSWFNFTKRYGFIMSDYGDVFVHKNNLLNRNSLRTGQLVEFDVRDAPRGYQAVNVVIITDEARSGNISALDSSDSEDDYGGISFTIDYRSNPFVDVPRAVPVPTPRTSLQSAPSKQIELSSKHVMEEEEDKSGFDTARFEGPIPDELICSICQGVLNDPVQTTCEHLFCRHCIEEWLCHQKVCPMDREPLHHRPLNSVPRYLKRMLGGLKLKCPFADKGCKKVVTLDEMESHQKDCSYAKSKTQGRGPANAVAKPHSANPTRHTHEGNPRPVRPVSPVRPARPATNPHGSGYRGQSTTHTPITTQRTSEVSFSTRQQNSQPYRYGAHVAAPSMPPSYPMPRNREPPFYLSDFEELTISRPQPRSNRSSHSSQTRGDSCCLM